MVYIMILIIWACYKAHKLWLRMDEGRVSLSPSASMHNNTNLNVLKNSNVCYHIYHHVNVQSTNCFPEVSSYV